MKYVLSKLALLVSLCVQLSSLQNSASAQSSGNSAPPVLLPPSNSAYESLPILQVPSEESLPSPSFIPPAPEPKFDNATVVEADEVGAAGTTPFPELLAEPVQEEPAWYAYPIFLIADPNWDTGIELGINGSTGSNEATSIRTGGYLKRESEFAEIDISGYYNKTSANGAESQNNAQLDVRNDWLLDKSSPWTLFATGTVFYDRFQAFDLQVNANLGVGYRIIDNERTDLTGRIGAGGTQDVGDGPLVNQDWVPEALFGFDLDHEINERQKIYAKVDYFPQMEDFNEYRLVTDVGWEVELVQPSNLSLKISVTDRYDSTPAGPDPELLNYSVLLLWKL